MLNGVLSALGLDGTSFFYVNPLQRRTHRAAAEPGTGERQAWHPCACCPPNLMRTLSSWEQQLATTDAAGIQVHQYATAELRMDVAGGEVRLAIATDYPWDGRVTVEVRATPDVPWTLTLRRPGWAMSAHVAWPGATDVDAGGGGGVSRSAIWRPGDRVVLELDMAPRIVEPDRRIDALRGTVALERGPLVQCLETADLPDGVDLEDLALDTAVKPVGAHRPDVAPEVIGVEAGAIHRRPSDRAWPYPPEPTDGPAADRSLTVRTIPYFAWANRDAGAMRVWIPRDDG
jgi:DUF1680 family protein